VDEEDAAALEDEAHLVLVVPVLAAELREHRLQVRGLAPHVDHVGRDVAAAGLEPRDLGVVGREHLVRRGGGRERVRRRPALVVDADRCEELRDRLLPLHDPVLGRNPDRRHL